MSASDQQKQRIRQVVFWLGDWATLMGFWIALTGSIRWTALLIGAVVALIGSILSVITEAMTLVKFLPHWRYFFQSRSVIWQIPMGAIYVVRALLMRGPRAASRLHMLPFCPGDENFEAQTRRAVAEALPSMAPASVIIGVDRDAGTVIFHLLGDSSSPPTLRRLGEAQ